MAAFRSPKTITSLSFLDTFHGILLKDYILYQSKSEAVKQCYACYQITVHDIENKQLKYEMGVFIHICDLNSYRSLFFGKNVFNLRIVLSDIGE